MSIAAQLLRLAAATAALSLAACQQRSGDNELASLDNEIIANETDPALTSALEDQILVDPALTQQSNKNAVRPPETPTQAQYPLPSSAAESKAAAGNRPAAARPAAAGAPAQAPTAPVRRASASQGDCAADLDYNLGWSRRLPAAFAVYPGSRVTDAAGNDRADCRSRVVTFTVAAPPQRVLDHYRSRAAGAGYSAEHQMREGDHVLAGTSQAGGAFYLILTPLRGGGSDVALITNGG